MGITPTIGYAPLNMDADSQVDDFCSVTGATRDRALFFLQAAKGNLQVALDAFYNEESVEDQVRITRGFVLIRVGVVT